MEEYNFWIPSEPKPKQRPRTLKTGHTYTPTQTQQAEWEIRTHVAERIHTMMEGPIWLDVTAWVTPPQMPKKWRGKRLPDKRPDLDQYIKLALDALNGIAYKDDAQVVKIIARKQYAWNVPAGWSLRVGTVPIDVVGNHQVQER